jgi:hypothetical protein
LPVSQRLHCLQLSTGKIKSKMVLFRDQTPNIMGFLNTLCFLSCFFKSTSVVWYEYCMNRRILTFSCCHFLVVHIPLNPQILSFCGGTCKLLVNLRGSQMPQVAARLRVTSFESLVTKIGWKVCLSILVDISQFVMCAQESIQTWGFWEIQYYTSENAWQCLSHMCEMWTLIISALLRLHVLLLSHTDITSTC